MPLAGRDSLVYRASEDLAMTLLHTDEACELIQMEYAEIPDLTLTFWQARHLWNLSDELCARALTTLVVSGFLARTSDGQYVHRSDPPRGDEVRGDHARGF
jgi:hypothetical protein